MNATTGLSTTALRMCSGFVRRMFATGSPTWGNAVSVRLGSGSGSTIRCWLFLVRGQILVEELPHPIDRLLRSLDCDVAAELRDPAVEH